MRPDVTSLLRSYSAFLLVTFLFGAKFFLARPFPSVNIATRNISDTLKVRFLVFLHYFAPSSYHKIMLWRFIYIAFFLFCIWDFLGYHHLLMVAFCIKINPRGTQRRLQILRDGFDSRLEPILFDA